MEHTSDWRVRVYNKRDKVIKSWIIENRTENEASKEAEADIANNYPNAADWSMTKIEK